VELITGSSEISNSILRIKNFLAIRNSVLRISGKMGRNKAIFGILE
jgi:hypothetical protein